MCLSLSEPIFSHPREHLHHKGSVMVVISSVRLLNHQSGGRTASAEASLLVTPGGHEEPGRRVGRNGTSLDSKC